jgi:hypothetical protein
MRLVSVIALLFAVAPQVLYLGRPLTDEEVTAAVQSVPPGHEEHAKAAAEHVGHCHVGPKGCASSDGAVNVASLTDAIEALTYESAASAIESAEPLHSFVLWQRPEKPPRSV